VKVAISEKYTSLPHKVRSFIVQAYDNFSFNRQLMHEQVVKMLSNFANSHPTKLAPKRKHTIFILYNETAQLIDDF